MTGWSSMTLERVAVRMAAIGRSLALAELRCNELIQAYTFRIRRRSSMIPFNAGAAML